MKPRSIFDEINRYLDASEAIVLTGMRRTGKTTLLQFIYKKIDSTNKIFLDLENPLNRKYFEGDNYENIKGAFEILGIDFTRKAYIFLDEIQFIKNLPSVVKYFVDHYQAKFFLTGSASFYMKHLFTESLAGRKFIFELFPLSFQEFLTFKDVSFKIPDASGAVNRAVFDTLSPLYEEYILFGGFPGVVLKSGAEEKRKVLEDIFSSFFQLEVLQLGDFRKNEVIRNLMLLLMQRTGSKLDIQKISRELGVSRQTMTDYIAFLESTYFIKTIRPFSKGRSAEIRKTPKVYICDTGLVNHFARLDTGALFENSVFQNLRLRGELSYYRKKTGVEIDFILNKEQAYEVKTNPYSSDLKKLSGLSQELNLGQYKIVSKNYCNLGNTVYGFML
jgi:predicted AAA+ superfamily ATPase